MNKIPKLKYLLPTIEEDAKTISLFCEPMNTGWDWSHYVYKAHPKLEQMINGSKDPKMIEECCFEYVVKSREALEGELAKERETYQNEWNKINDSVLGFLSEHFETTWPEEVDEIKAYISLCPILPRFLDKWSFNVCFQSESNYLRQVTCHEALHLIYFKKWLEVFPETKPEERDAPHLVWRLSEIFDPIIVNNNPRLQKLIQFRARDYDEFVGLKIGGKDLVGFFTDMYIEHLNSNRSFAEFLRASWEVALKHRSVIEGV